MAVSRSVLDPVVVAVRHWNALFAPECCPLVRRHSSASGERARSRRLLYPPPPFFARGSEYPFWTRCSWPTEARWFYSCPGPCVLLHRGPGLDAGDEGDPFPSPGIHVARKSAAHVKRRPHVNSKVQVDMILSTYAHVLRNALRSLGHLSHPRGRVPTRRRSLPCAEANVR
jgi:hypothetical protein